LTMVAHVMQTANPLALHQSRFIAADELKKGLQRYFLFVQ
jgi:hypothetical protein